MGPGFSAARQRKCSPEESSYPEYYERRSSPCRQPARFFPARVQSIASSGLDRDCRAHRRLGVDSVSAHRSAAALLYVQDGQNPPVSDYWLHGAAHVLALQLSNVRCDLCGLFGWAG